ncbi:MAG TPA: xanthine dehydrogenase family protein subunit M [Dissulfurispiraceae bacterium]|nr:xanthine dehydrogenase family protein subunit M [Dissulfurispiraceae bacterium]
MIPNFSYIQPRSLEQVIDHLSPEGSVLHAGGTDLLGCLRDGVFPATKMVSLNALGFLRGIAETSEGGVRIGSLTTISQVAGHPLLKSRYAALAQAASEVGSPQLRNQGTLGGNICQRPRCWYYRGEFHCLRKGGAMCYAVAGENQFHCIFGGEGCYIVHPSDTAPALMALGATLRIAGPAGSRTVPVENFFVLPRVDVTRENVLKSNEVVTDIILPPPPQGSVSSYRKARARRSWDFALAGVAVALVFRDGLVTDARVVLSGVAPVPWRAKDAEDALTGKRLDGEIKTAAAAAVRGAKPLSGNAYKIALTQGLIEEALLAHTRSG